MPRVLFVENREKTYFWRLVAERLQNRGHPIGWIVQNPMFGKKLPGKVYPLGLPRKTVPAINQQQFSPLIKTDRGNRFFDNGNVHYSHYYNVIEQAINDFQPDFVVGEATLFHEIIAADLAGKMDSIYLHPTGERYPSGRFVIFRDTTQTVFSGSGAPMLATVAHDLAKQISTGSKLPDYMRKTSNLTKIRSKWRWAYTRFRVWVGRLVGERFNTPSMLRKFVLMQGVKRNIRRWHEAASIPDPNESKPLLYPLQLQPESNIDIWGNKYSDQLALIQRLLAAIPEGCKLALKANPKTYMEMSDSLLDYAVENERILLLPIAMDMSDAQTVCLGAVTVTGTIGFEAVCGRGRCISLGHPILEAHFPDFCADSPEAAVDKLIAEPNLGEGSPELGARLVDLFHRRSYAGKISDPVSDPACLDAENIRMVSDGLAQALSCDILSSHTANQKTEEAAL